MFTVCRAQFRHVRVKDEPTTSCFDGYAHSLPPPLPSFVLVFPSSGLKISTLRGKLCWRHSARAWPSNFSVESSIKHGQLLSVWRSVGREKHLNSTRIEFCNLLALTLIYDSIFALLRIKIKYQENYYPFRHIGLDQSMFCL